MSEYLERCSRLSHMLFFLFRKNKPDFCAVKNYRNWQDTVGNMLVNVALAQEHGITDFYFFLNSNKRIEQLFGISRSTRRGNLNFDCLDLRDRLGDAVLIQWIYSEHPEWDRSVRRLTNTVDRKNTHLRRGDTKVANVDITKCWNEGKTWAVAKLTESRIFQDDPTELDISQIMSNGSGINMLRPYCIERSVGVLAGDQAIYDLGDLELDDEDDE